ncbi:MAG TPA: dimethylglycine dehydrogenase, partial [Alphaproteobacteria bacterium]|nr:dimethylglycine dehydrogenase [Alphaproteobacteria bacterium]
GAGQRLDHDWIKKHMPDDGSVRFDDLTNSIGVLVLAGPHARDILQKVTRSDLANGAFPWLSSKMIDVNLAPTMAFRMNYVGELGWELHHPIEYQNHIFDALMDAGAEFQLKPFGIRA